MSLADQLIERAARRPQRIVFPEGDDPRVIAAAFRIQSLGIGTPLLLAEPEAFDAARRSIQAPEPNFAVISPNSEIERFGGFYHEHRKHKGLDLEQATEQARDPLIRAALMVRHGDADTAVGGAVRTTADTVRAAIQCIGAVGNTVSSFFHMLFEDRALLYADCGVIPEPDAAQLAEIAIISAQSWRQLTGLEPKVAMLSFSTHGSASHSSIDVIHQALALAKAAAPDLAIDGDLQADAALIADIGRRKAPNSAVAGSANVLIFPNLHAGNIAYKLTERLAGATALGPILQGLKQPMNDLSRGCKTEDIVLVSAISAIQAAEGA